MTVVSHIWNSELATQSRVFQLRRLTDFLDTFADYFFYHLSRFVWFVVSLFKHCNRRLFCLLFIFIFVVIFLMLWIHSVVRRRFALSLSLEFQFPSPSSTLSLSLLPVWLLLLPLASAVVVGGPRAMSCCSQSHLHIYFVVLLMPGFRISLPLLHSISPALALTVFSSFSLFSWRLKCWPKQSSCYCCCFNFTSNQWAISHTHSSIRFVVGARRLCATHF